MTKEPLPLATIQAAVFEFLQNRDDAVVFGAQAVNVYVGEPRMTQDIDLKSVRAAALVEELREYLSQRFYIAACIREVKAGVWRGFGGFERSKRNRTNFGVVARSGGDENRARGR